MKYLLYLAAIAILFFAGCKKNEDLKMEPDAYQNEAVITGYDFSECNCCGGYIFSMVADPGYGMDFLASEIPAGSGISKYGNYPIYVVVNWKVDSTGGCNNRIVVTSIRKK